MVPSYRPTANRLGLVFEKSRDVTLDLQLKVHSGHYNTYKETLNSTLTAIEGSDILSYKVNETPTVGLFRDQTQTSPDF